MSSTKRIIDHLNEYVEHGAASVSFSSLMPESEVQTLADAVRMAKEERDELLEALKLICDGIEQSRNDNVVGASMRVAVQTLRELLRKAEGKPVPA